MYQKGEGRWRDEKPKGPLRQQQVPSNHTCTVIVNDYALVLEHGQDVLRVQFLAHRLVQYIECLYDTALRFSSRAV